ncbi:hypothetical protein [Apilactobacillus ozensis]|uniref:hypothetical protein n=1 Tax=Apilactobacillus ozensis TaxID=866801 RepID=UPI00200B8739|nr:hypothetical protein [Apilactobacillus ozensis]MCK8607214.1 hypothetical protein [Apilactobacillus ozensis]
MKSYKKRLVVFFKALGFTISLFSAFLISGDLEMFIFALGFLIIIFSSSLSSYCLKIFTWIKEKTNGE